MGLLRKQTEYTHEVKPESATVFRPWFDVVSHWEIDAPLCELQAVLSDPMSILKWWSSVFIDGEVLHEGRGGSDKGFRDITGMTVRFYTTGLLPHAFQFIARVTDVSADRIAIGVQGDFNGQGEISLSEKGGRTQARLHWSVTVAHPYLWPFLRILKPVFVWNHRWAMRRGRLGLIEFIKRKNRVRHAIQKPTFPHNIPLFQTPRRWRV